MEILTSHVQAHYKKLLIICTATVSMYLLKNYFDKRKRTIQKRKIKEFPSIEEIQKFIEDLPFDGTAVGCRNITLKDLLGELSEFSEDEDWKELIQSVRTLYKDHQSPNVDNVEETGSVGSIYEDPNVVSLNSPRNDEETEIVTPKDEE